MLERFNMQESKAAITPTVMGLKLSGEDSSKDFDPSLYKSIVGNLMYLTYVFGKAKGYSLASSKKDFEVC